jgi:hypothetical protein
VVNAGTPIGSRKACPAVPAVSAKSYTSGSTLQRDEVYGTLRAALLSAVALGAKGKSVATIDSFEESALAHATPAIEICV